jgi:hypothetical protein
LYELARFGNMARIQQHARLLEQNSARYRPFAQRVYRLAEAFDDEAIQRLVQQSLNDGALAGVAEYQDLSDDTA